MHRSCLIGLMLASSCAEPGRAQPASPARSIDVADPPRVAESEAELPECSLAEADVNHEADVDPSLDRASAGCVVSGQGLLLDGPLVLHRTPALDAPLATLSQTHPAVISDFQDGRDVARISVRGSLQLRGYAALGGIELRNPDLLWIHPKLVSAEPQSRIRIERHRDGRLEVRVHTSFDEPKWLSASVQCDELSVGEPFEARQVREPRVHVLPEGRSMVELVRPPTPVHDAPNGRKLFSFAYTASSNYPTLLETRGGFARIAARFDNISIEAWVPAAEVAVPVRISGYTRTRAPKVRMGRVDYGVFAQAPSGADVYVGQPGSLVPVGRLMPNERVRVRGSSGELVVIETLDGFTAPRDADFWVRRSLIAECQLKKTEPS